MSAELLSQVIGFRERGPRVIDAVRRAQEVNAAELEAYVQRNKLSGDPVRVVTGRLRRSINGKVLEAAGVIAAVVGTNVEYAPYVEEGSAPHEIVPTRARVLSWLDANGGRVFARRVQHPGTQGKHFMRDSLRETKDKIKDRIRNAVAGAVR